MVTGTISHCLNQQIMGVGGLARPKPAKPSEAEGGLAKGTAKCTSSRSPAENRRHVPHRNYVDFVNLSCQCHAALLYCSPCGPTPILVMLLGVR